MSTDVDDFLIHFGTKGMKWGVRKSETPASPKSKEQLDKEARNKKIAKGVAIGAAAVAATGLTVYGIKQVHNYRNIEKYVIGGDSFTKDILKRYGKDTGKVFEEGTEFARKSRSVETALKGRTFAILKGGDQSRYADNPFWGSHDITIKALTEIRTPSTKERVDLLGKTMPFPVNNPVKIRLNQAAEVKNLGAKLAVKSFGDKKLGAVRLSQITSENWHGADAVKFADQLKKSGFSATWDDWDKKDAFVLFNENAFRYSEPALNR